MLLSAMHLADRWQCPLSVVLELSIWEFNLWAARDELMVEQRELNVDEETAIETAITQAQHHG